MQQHRHTPPVTQPAHDGRLVTKLHKSGADSHTPLNIAGTTAAAAAMVVATTVVTISEASPVNWFSKLDKIVKVPQFGTPEPDVVIGAGSFIIIEFVERTFIIEISPSLSSEGTQPPV